MRAPAAATLALCFAGALGCGGVGEDSSATIASESPVPAVESVLVVDAARVRRGAIAQKIAAPASLVAHRRARIGPEVSGLIREVAVEEGDRVVRGDLLFEIDAEPYELGHRRALAGLDRARAGRHQVETELARASALRSQQVMADEVTDRLASQLEAARAQEGEARAAAALAHRNSAGPRVVAPFGGAVAWRCLPEGNLQVGWASCPPFRSSGLPNSFVTRETSGRSHGVVGDPRRTPLVNGIGFKVG